MARVRVTFGKKVPLGKVPEIYVEASFEDEVPQGMAERDFYDKIWVRVEEEVNSRVEKHIESTKPRCERCGKAVTSLFSTWDEEKREYLQLCYDDYQDLERKQGGGDI
jgi:hypothetical protein